MRFGNDWPWLSFRLISSRGRRLNRPRDLGQTAYQRGSRRWRENPPPPPLKPPPPPWGLGRASLTFRFRPSRLLPLRAAIAWSACEASDISTKAKPRERPVSRSVTMLTRSTLPYGSNRERTEDSVAEKSRFPTKMFFKNFYLFLSFNCAGQNR